MGKEKNTQVSKSSKGSSLITKIMLISLGISTIIISTHAFIFYIFSILPSIVALFTDKRVSKAASSTITAFNLIGIFPYLIDFWQAPNEAAFAAQSFMSRTEVWFRVYIFSAIGWVFIWAIPTITGYIFLLRIERKIRRLKKLQDELVDEWGNTIKYK